MNKVKRQLLDKTFKIFMEVGLGGENLDLLNLIVAKDVVGFGTTIDEKIFGLNELRELLVRQKEQSAGMEVSWKINTLDIHISNDENTAIFTNDLKFYITVDGNTIDMYMRFSVVLEYAEEKWMVVHWHGSKPELAESEKDTWGLETWKEKAEALEKEVAERTADLVEKNWELKVEAALERVRAVAMGMKKPEDLLEVCRVISNQLVEFGVEKIRNVQIAIIDEIIGQYLCYQYFTTYKKTAIEKTEYLKSPVEHGMVKQMLASRDGYFIGSLNGNELEEFREHRKAENHFPDSFLDEATELDYCFLSIGEGGLGLTLYQPMDEEILTLFKRFHQVFSLAYQRFRDIQKAEAQARESQIEAGLERVRSAALAMHQSDDLRFSLQKLFEELDKLELGMIRCGIAILDPSKPRADVWIMAKSGDNNSIQLSGNEPLESNFMLLKAYKAWKKGNDYECILEGSKLNEYYHSLDKINFQSNLKSTYSKEIKTHRQHYFNAAFKHGSLFAFFEDQMPDHGKTILKRFSNVLNLAYSRFSDIQIAEEQAREAQIQLALERVRAKSMAMHRSDELADLSLELVKQVHALGVNTWFCAFNIYDDDLKGSLEWGSNGQGTFPQYRTPREGIFLQYYESGQNGETLLINEIGEKECPAHYDYLCSLPGVGAQLLKMKDAGIPFPTSQIDHVAYFNYGYIIFITFEPAPEAHDIFKRFAKVFEQTYTRFLDLQKAETQTREAKIEAALEKVRSRTMGMQSSDELPEVANLLFTEVRALGIPAWSCGYNILDDDKKTASCWMSSEGTLQTPFKLRLWGEASFDEMGDFLRSEKTMLVQELGENTIDQHYAHMKSFPDLKPTFDQIDAQGLSLPTYQINHLCKFTQGFLLFITYEKVPESHDIFKRFTKVFDQTYTRFLDLKKAEAQAIEATKQSSLDRVRGEISSMRNADDLDRITPLVFNELTTLGIPFIRCGVFIVHEKERNVEIYLSTPKGKSLAAMNLPFDANETTARSVEAWKNEEVYSHHWNQTDFVNFGKSLQEQGHITNLQIYQGSETPPESLHLHFVPFVQGLLYVGSPETLTEEQIDLVKALAKSFAIAYARYEDFVKLEQAKAEVESSMIELKATQSQLVQQEKLASLGQLTAGIAHEIKNPLNFVNNFSEVSLELIEEAREEILSEKAKGKNEKSLSQPVEVEDDAIIANDEESALILEILNDIEANLRKIHEHGTRADSIVKSMLQHSRGGDGKMEPSPLNPLIKEYVNLAFHGMRAGKDPINVDVEMDLNESIGNVPLLAEDFSRVILNVCNNAFDAMREKTIQNLKFKIQNYSPKLMVRTKQQGSEILIEIEDNGPGIPDEIKDKILQPFFTTKKGTQGTGLGLSITNDIIKAHGGNIAIKSREGQGSTFTIFLPGEKVS